MTSKGHFPPKPFDDSMILSPKPRATAGAPMLRITLSTAALPLLIPQKPQPICFPLPLPPGKPLEALQSCYTARCSLTFPTRLSCAKHLAPTGAWEALGEPWQQERFLRLLSLNDRPHFHSGPWSVTAALCCAPHPGSIIGHTAPRRLPAVTQGTGFNKEPLLWL